MIKKVLVMIGVVIFFAPKIVIGVDGISYSGSSTIGQGILQVGGAIKAFREKTNIKFTSIKVVGSGEGIKALMDEKVNLAGASRSLTPEEKKKGLLGHIIGYDAIAVFVHKNNPVKNLTKEQLKGIFTGKIKNWKEVGGKDAPITPNTEFLEGKRATIEMFQELVMDKAPYAKGFKEINLPKDQLIYLSSDETGICSVSFGLINVISDDVLKKIKLVAVNNILPTGTNLRSGAYLITRPLLLVTKGLPKDDVRTFIDFMLSNGGQAIVEKSDFVSVREKK